MRSNIAHVVRKDKQVPENLSLFQRKESYIVVKMRVICLERAFLEELVKLKT